MMNGYRAFLGNHVLANLTFALVLVLGIGVFATMPRERDPEINFNWINILTVLPGASAIDVEKRITDPIEEAISRAVQDIDFVSSTSRESTSTILVRFNQLDERTFDKRMADLRREVQNAYTDQLPEEADDPVIREITTSSGFPSATVVVQGLGADESFRRQARAVKEELERITGVNEAQAIGLYGPELHIRFYPQHLEGLGITPADIADTVHGYFRDVSVGDLETSEGKWVIRMQGTNADPRVLTGYPVVTANGVVPLGSIADVVTTTEEPDQLVRFQGKPAVSLTITKDANTNVLNLLDRIRHYIEEKNQLADSTGLRLFLIDDQTVSTRQALSLMQNNAMIGLVLVLLVTWLFLGSRIAFFTSLGIPFTLAGTFLLLSAMGMTLNNSVLLGVVIALGMIVDDAVVVVEAIHYRFERGIRGMGAVFDSLREVFAPVTTSVLTTIAAFLPLTLLPGILGDFMRVIPLTVCIALAVSLLEAYWMLPVHVGTGSSNRVPKTSRVRKLRWKAIHSLRLNYTRWLLRAMRFPGRAVAIVFGVLLLAALALGSGRIPINFFASDVFRLFYVNVEMPKGTTLEQTLAAVEQAETETLALLENGELRGSVAIAGQMFTQTEPLFGENIGQATVSLNPRAADGREVQDINNQVESAMASWGLPGKVTLLRVEDGPPVAKPISVKVRGDDFAEIRAAADALEAFMLKAGQEAGHFTNITQDYRPGNPELVLRLDGEAIKRAGISPLTVTRTIQAYVDGEIVSQFQRGGEEVKVRVKAQRQEGDIDMLLRQTIPLSNGQSIALGDLVHATYTQGQQNIRHYNFRRTITLEADIREEQTDTVSANRLIQAHWAEIRDRHPTINLDFSGELDDVFEAIDSIALLMGAGLGLIYLILGAQFKSYWQPFLIIFGTLPLAITGVILGLLVTRNPLSLYTLYGTVALIGISVNAAIVLISAANDRLEAGMSVLHATVYAARRRVVPILITSLTTIAGLFSLAAGLAGKSLVWGPVATAIVSGLAVSTLLTLFVVPLFYRLSMGYALRRGKTQSPTA
jgi:multidrug efflux pump subunit AcrB